MEESSCPLGACVSCASAALAAQEFRLFVRNSEKLWLKAISNLTNLDYDDNVEEAKSMCAFITPNDLSIQTTKDYTGDEPKTVVNRLKSKAKKIERKPRTYRGGPMSTCQDCNKTFNSPYFLHEHLKNSGRKDACQMCGYMTSRGLAMKEHMVQAHKENPTLCPQCPALFIKVADFEKHKYTAHRAGVYTCTDCGRTFPRKSSFEHHFDMHNVRTCRRCHLQFTNRGCYRAHRSECEPDAKPDSKSLPRSRRTNIRDPAIFICDYCDKKYKTRPQLKNHILWIHMDVRPHQCQWCGKRFYTFTRMAEHSVVHTRARNFECDICGAKLVSKMAAVYHRRRHTGERPYKCEDCDAEFISASRRMEHAKRKHNKGTRVPCQLCSASFVRKGELKKHMDKVHSNAVEKNPVWEVVLEPKLGSVS